MDVADRRGTGLRGALLRAGAARPHVLVVAAVGGTEVRLAVEAELADRGWPAASSPADTDLLVVAGSPGPALGAVLDTVWTQVPAPRARAQIAEPGSVSSELDTAVAVLRDRNRQQLDRVARPVLPARSDEDPHSQHNAGAAHDEHRGHGGHHDMHGDMGMAMPGGLAIADLGPDRDGLILDQLHVPLGPALPDWPPGLVIHVVLQGDVLQQAEAGVLDAGSGGSFWDEPRRRAATGTPVSRGSAARRRAARDLDSLARLLAVAGWEDQAVRARRLRDRLLAGEPSDRLTGAMSDFARRVSPSRMLRWLTRGIPVGDSDVWGRLQRRIADAVDAVSQLDDDGPFAPDGPARPIDVDQLASQLVGLELAAARLVVAALDPDTDAVAPAEHTEASHG